VGSRRSTSRDVAKLAGVSQATVSLVLNSVAGARIGEKSRRRVVEAARKLDYHPNASARSLVRQRAGVLGLALRQHSDFLGANAFLPRVIAGLTSVTVPAGFKLLIEPIEDLNRPDTYLRLAREAHVDGMILSGVRSDDDQLRRLSEADFPVVLWGRLDGSDLPFVDVDNMAAARTAVEHLIGLGHRRIACITNGPPEDSASTARLAGYRQALDAAGLPFDGALVRYGDFEERSGSEAMLGLLSEAARPSAVFVASDEVALGALKTLRARGFRVPDDIALVGFDDLPISEFVDPALTTMRVPARAIGAQAAAMLIELITAHGEPESRFLPTELVIRESCGASRDHQHAFADGSGRKEGARESRALSSNRRAPLERGQTS
jgi:LacI family transcriptional regulator